MAEIKRAQQGGWGQLSGADAGNRRTELAYRLSLRRALCCASMSIAEPQFATHNTDGVPACCNWRGRPGAEVIPALVRHAGEALRPAIR